MTGYPVVIVCILLHSSSFHGLFMRKVYRNFCTFKMLEARSDQRIVSDNIFGLHKIAISALAGGSLVIRKANAIGQLSELQNYSMILQDICFSIPVANGTNIQRDCEALTALFINNCRILRAGARKLENGISYQNAVLGFGPDCYTVPRDFSPGISSFKQYGGHSTITLQESLEGDQYQNWGNGLRFIKVGADTIRLSKAVEKGIYDVPYNKLIYGTVKASNTPWCRITSLRKLG